MEYLIVITFLEQKICTHQLYLVTLATTSSRFGVAMWEFSAAFFCWYAQNLARPCSYGDQVVTDRHTHTHTRSLL